MEEASSSSSSSSSCASPRAAPCIWIAVREVPLSASEEDLKNHFGRYGKVVAVDDLDWDPWTKIATLGVPLVAREEDLKNHFGMHGDVEMEEDLNWEPYDSDGREAFVYFADEASAKRASASREKNNHIILGKLVEVSRLSIWRQQRRIKVKNLPPRTTSSQFRAYFEQFGTVTEAVIKPDGSSYVVFKCDESLRKVLTTKLHLFYGTELKLRRESPDSEAFLVANAAQHESAGATSSATSYIPTRPVNTDSTRIATTPYDAPYTPSYNQPTTSIPHAYSTAPTPPFGTPYTSSDNRPISVTTYTYGAPSISPYGVPATSFYNRPTTTTPHVYSAPTTAFGIPSTSSYNRPISVTTYANGAPSISQYGIHMYPVDTVWTPHVSSAHTPPSATLYTPSYNRPASAIPHAYSNPNSKAPQIEDTAAACRALNLGETDSDNIDGHKVDVKQAELKETRTAEPSRISSSNANVPNDKRIFVGRLPTDITYGEFRAYFEKFGSITNAFVKTDKSNRCRCFGFVTFETKESADKVLMDPFHMIRPPDERVEVKKAITKIEGNIRRDNNNNDNGVSSNNNIIDGHKVDGKQAELKETRTAESSRNSSSNANVPNEKQIFVGGLPADITDDEFQTYFEEFGRITEAYVVLKKDKIGPQGFGFVTFETEESAHKVLKKRFHVMRGYKKVEVKKAIPYI